MAQDDPNTIITTIAKQLTSDITINSNDKCICFDTSNQFIGINTITPSVALDIQNGNAHVDGNITATGSISGGTITSNGNINASSGTITGGTITSNGNINANSGTITGSTITSTGNINAINGIINTNKLTTSDTITCNGTGGIIISSQSNLSDLSDNNVITKHELSLMLQNQVYFENVYLATVLTETSSGHFTPDSGDDNLLDFTSNSIIDGSSVSDINNGQHVLINFQSEGWNRINNGVYTKTSNTTLERRLDLRSGTDICNSVFVYVEYGSKNKNTGWVLGLSGDIINPGKKIGTDPLSFHKVSSFGANNNFAHTQGVDNVFHNNNTFNKAPLFSNGISFGDDGGYLHYTSNNYFQTGGTSISTFKNGQNIGGSIDTWGGHINSSGLGPAGELGRITRWGSVNVGDITCMSIDTRGRDINTVRSSNQYEGAASGSLKVGDISCRSINVTLSVVSSNVLQTSDDRIKHNEINISGGLALSTIRKLNPQLYQKTTQMYAADFTGEISGNWQHEMGLIAQDVMQIPELAFCVAGGDYTDPSGNLVESKYILNYDNIFVMNIAATKEIDSELTELKTKVELLEVENTTLKTQNSDIMSRLTALENPV